MIAMPSRKRTRVAITIDTEPSVAGAFADGARFKPLIHEPVWGEVAGQSEALGFIMRTLTACRLRATFFVETVHLTYFPEGVMGEYARRLQQAGQDVQLHLHPVWARFESEKFAKVNDSCRELDESRLVELIGRGVDQISTWCGRRPKCLRTGNFSVSRSIYRAMRAADLTVASNICLAVAPPREKELHLAGGIHRIEGIVELPVTCFRDRGPIGRGRYRPLQISACSFTELRDLLDAMHRAGVSLAVVVTHPFEFLKWHGPDFSRLRANRLVQRRFERLCRFLADNSDRFETVGIDQVEVDTEGEDEVVLDGSPIDSAWRSLENFVNDRIPL
jgi:hypothetical protein